MIPTRAETYSSGPERAPGLFPLAAIRVFVRASPSTMPPSISSSSIATQKDLDALSIINYQLVDFDTGHYRRRVCEPRGTLGSLSSIPTGGAVRVLLGHGKGTA